MVFLCCAGSQAQNIFSKKPLKMAGGCELLIADSVATVTIDKDGDNSGAFATRLSVDTDGADNGGIHDADYLCQTARISLWHSVYLCKKALLKKY